MAATGSACQPVVRWVITPLAASPASFQPSKAAMMTVALSLIAHHLPPRRLPAMPVPAYVVLHDHLLSCPARCHLTPGRSRRRASRLETYDEERPQGPQLEPGGRGAGGVA